MKYYEKVRFDDSTLKDIIAAFPTQQQKSIFSHWGYFNLSKDFRSLELADFDHFRSSKGARLSEYFDDLGDSFATLALFEELEGMYPSRVKNQLETTVGHPTVHAFEGINLNFNDLNLVYFALSIQDVLIQAGYKSDDSLRILSIGDGFGGLTSKMSKLYPNSSFVLADLPESCVVTSYYLGTLHGFQQVTYITELSSQISNPESKFSILDSRNSEKIRGIRFDLIINTRSLMEMSKLECREWLAFINANIKLGGIFYQANRYLKNTSGWANRIRDYEYGKNWAVALSKPLPFQKHIHELVLIKTDYPSDAFVMALRNLPKNGLSNGGNLHSSEVFPRTDFWIRILPRRILSRIKEKLQRSAI